MLNSKPNNKQYNQGNYIPINKDKIIKLNSEGGVYYRSSLEKKMMIWLDNNPKVTRWCGECLKVPYQLTHFNKGDMILKNHTYHSDFYYELDVGTYETKKIVCEVKPMKEVKWVNLLNENKLVAPPEGTPLKKLRSWEYDFKMAQKNLEKWESMIKFCSLKGYVFKLVTEEHFKRNGII